MYTVTSEEVTLEKRGSFVRKTIELDGEIWAVPQK
jgi:hypothetical protein